ncbi:MAG: iron transporter [Ruminococcus sp.]|nr:iron transporter [Ruminococcus sp.]
MTKKIIGISLIAAMAAAFTGCGSTADSSSTSAPESSSQAEVTEAAEESEAEETDAEVEAEPAAAAPGETEGFVEIPIFEDEECGFLNVSAVYFQPVPMSGGNESIEDFDLHLEADIAALQNDLGYGVGDWVPYLTVDYDVIGSDGSTAASGTFMEMSASDGPHYGANIALPDADTYTLKLTIHSPEENGYLLHVDAETGPGGTFDEYFADGNLTVEFDGWEYIPQEW